MNRRDFLRLSAAAGIGQSVLGSHLLCGQSANAYDRYGGWKGKRFQATGFFRVEKDDRWWLVTPEGNAFLSWGINHLYPDLWMQEYNKEVWRIKLGLSKMEYGPAFSAALKAWFLDTCDQFGFNTVGVHNALQIVNTPSPKVPYMRPIHFVDVPHWKGDIPDENFKDVFAPEFEAHCDGMAKELALPVKDDPYLLAYAMTDCTLFTEEDLRERTDTIGGARRPSRIGWPRRLRNLGASAPGKQVYVQTMKDVYRGSIGAFNTTYGTTFRNFDTLAAAENWRPDSELWNIDETRDNAKFLHRVVDRYYQVTRDSIRRYDPNHMFFGDKIHANTDSLDTVLPITSRYTDAIFYQMYARYEVQEPGLDRWSKVVDKPFINGDSAFTMVTDTMPRPYGPIADNLEQRAEWTEEFFRKAFARPEFVGWHYCGLIDASQLVTRKQDRQHSGLLDGYGNAYPNLVKVLKTCSSEIYDIARG